MKYLIVLLLLGCTRSDKLTPTPGTAGDYERLVAKCAEACEKKMSRFSSGFSGYECICEDGAIHMKDY